MPKFVELTVLDAQGMEKEKRVFNLAGLAELGPRQGGGAVLRTFDDQHYSVRESAETIFTSTELRQWTVL